MSQQLPVFNPFAGPAIVRTAPVTPEQQEIWLSVQLGGTDANLAYNESLAIHFVGELDRAALHRALDALVVRHEALRTTLSGDGTTLCISDSTTMQFAEEDLSAVSETVRHPRCQVSRRQSVMEPFDLVAGPLVRAVLLSVGSQEHELLIVAHHIICDGWSGAMLVEELGQLYTAERSGVPAQLGPAWKFSDYANARKAEQFSEEARRAKSYWLAQYRHVPPPLDLPTDRQRSAERSFAADRIDFRVSADVTRRLKSVGARHGASLVNTVFAAFQVFLSRITGQRAVVTGMAVAGQSLVGQESLIGHCVRTLPIRGDIDLGRSFLEQLALAKTQVFDALEHANLTFGSLVQELALSRDSSRIPLMPVLFNIDPDVKLPEFSGLQIQVSTVPRAYENFELFLNGTVIDDELAFEATFNTDLFSRESMESRLVEFESLLTDIARDPSCSIGQLAIMPAEERAIALNQTQAGGHSHTKQTLVALFRQNAGKNPDKMAVESEGRAVTYAELDRRSRGVAAVLKQKGIERGARVGVLLERSADLVVGMLGVLRTGAAYVPLDPEYPTERIDFIARDAGLKVLVSDTGLAGAMPSLDKVVVSECSASNTDNDIDESQPGDAAYVIYTSGSTGKPKGVIVEHSNVVNFLHSMHDAPGMTEVDTLLAVTTPSFDISVLELFLPLLVGGKVIIASTADVADGQKLAERLSKSGATILQATPAGWRALIEGGWSGDLQLKGLCGGEVLPADLALAIRSRVKELWNCYGPTETTVWSTVERVDSDTITIGRPIQNTTVYVLDELRQPVPVGVVGELYIAGAGVSRGYLDRPALTQERFLVDPFVAGQRMYRTGDLARLRRDGRVDWLGRADFQVKVRGYRIELGEIEARLCEIPSVREAVVVVREDRPGDQRIVAYLRGNVPPESELRNLLGKHLPRYMLPQHYIQVDAYPLTPNGKVDRRALPPPGGVESVTYREPTTDVEKAVAKGMYELLGVARVGLDDDFFLLGGHSLLAMKLVAHVRTQFGVDIPVRAVFTHSTVAGFSDLVQSALVLRSGSLDVSASEEREEQVL